MKFEARIDVHGEEIEPGIVVSPGAFGTGKKTVPLYSGPEGTLNRRIIGEVEIDLETGLMEGTIDE